MFKTSRSELVALVLNALDWLVGAAARRRLRHSSLLSADAAGSKGNAAAQPSPRQIESERRELKASRWDRRGDEACLTLKQIRAARFSGANLTISVLPPPRGPKGPSLHGGRAKDTEGGVTSCQTGEQRERRPALTHGVEEG